MNKTKLEYLLNAIFVLIIGTVLMGAFGYQVIKHENPCPLCLLQRLGMLGIAVGCMMNLKFGISMTHYGLMIFSALFGGSVSLRQIALHVCPNFPTFGQPVLGFSLYTWAFFVFAASIFAIGVLLEIFGTNRDKKQTKPVPSFINKVAFVYIFFISIAEVITTFFLCGFSACQG